MSDFPITLSPEAIEQAKRWISRKAPGSALRVGVKGGGCSGMEYVLRPDQATETDLTLSLPDLTVVCDPKSAKFLLGSTLVYTGNLMDGGFKFENPNASRSCGCGTSFTPNLARPSRAASAE